LIGPILQHRRKGAPHYPAACANAAKCPICGAASGFVVATVKCRTGYDNGMPGPAWADDVASTPAVENLTQLALSIPAESIESRAMPTDAMARDWHRSMLQGVEVPDEVYCGGFRGDAH